MSIAMRTPGVNNVRTRIATGIGARFDESIRIRKLHVGRFQEDIRIERNVPARFDECIRINKLTRSRFKDDAPLGRAWRSKSAQALRLEKSIRGVFQGDMPPPPGIYVPPVIVPPDVCYIPDGRITFDALWTGSGRIVLFCELHDDVPPLPATIASFAGAGERPGRITA